MMRGLARVFGQIVAVVLLAGPALAQVGTGPVPAHATTRSYGDGWTCDLGFQLTDGACVKLTLPANAYATGRSYGPGWSCLRGYAPSDTACIAITLPENAHLDRSGTRWRCDKEFTSKNGVCALER
ncbi:hypothetical protein OA50_04072 [Mameliella alba]|uniref:Secreted protein n=1 Tax=Mameliella alba TaxID=561184 RepID=A0A0B3S3M6_9RHOB|nr:hypothetical protein OA50_04072 [Mameliella alba]